MIPVEATEVGRCIQECEYEETSEISIMASFIAISNNFGISSVHNDLRLISAFVA